MSHIYPQNEGDFSYKAEINVHASLPVTLQCLQPLYPTAVFKEHRWDGTNFSNWLHMTAANGVTVRINTGLGGYYLDYLPEQLKLLIAKHSPVQLIFIDQNDNLSDNKDTLKLVQQSIQGQNLDKLDETINEWYINPQNDTLTQIIKEENPTIDLDELQDNDPEKYESMRDSIYGRDTSNPLRDLLNNTRPQIFQFRTEYEGESGAWGWSEETLNEELANIKTYLQIPLTVTGNDKRLVEMIENADGGYLRVYFITKLDTFLPLNTVEDTPPPTTITFSGHVSIGIVDQVNGTGHSITLPHTFTLPFSYDNLFIDRAVHYNWTDDIAGMTNNWCKVTEFKLNP